LGQFVTVGSSIATIYAVEVAEVGLSLPDRELAYLDLPLAYRGGANQRGPRVMLSTTFAGARHEWGGRVVRTESELDPVTRMVQVVAEVQDPYAAGPDSRRPPLAVGMYVEAEIEGRAFRDIAVVPRAALRGRSQVIVIDTENRVRFREVEVLRATTESVYIDRGLSAGELIAVSALDSPTEGMLVQVTAIDGDQIAATSPPLRLSPDPVTETRTVESTPGVRDAVSERPSWLSELLDDATSAPARTADRENASANVSRRRPPGADRNPTTHAPSSADAPTRTATVPEEAPAPPPAALAEAAPSPDPRPTVAVLPFNDINVSGRNADLGADLARSVTTQLEGIGSISVVPSATQASLVVGGGVQWLGDLVRVTAQIVDPRDGDVVRAVKIDGTVSDLQRVRAEVAAAIGVGIADALDAGGTSSTVERAMVNTVALRPFANVSQMPEDATLAEAIVVAVTERLGRLQSVSVVTEERDAVWVISGAVQRMGNVVRITANLIDRQQGSVVRAVKVDGPIDQLTRLQNEVAAELSNSVREATS